MSTLAPGDQAPSFELLDETGKKHSLESLIEAGPLVIFFYPKDETAVCTKEACGFRDDYSEFQGLGAQVVGVSRDNAESHAAFKANHQLPFPLLCDEGGRVAALFQVKKKFGLIPGRSTFVIDQAGVVRLSFTAALNASEHIKQALAGLRAISA